MDGPSSISALQRLCKCSSSVGTSLGVETLVVKILCASPVEGMASSFFFFPSFIFISEGMASIPGWGA